MPFSLTDNSEQQNTGVTISGWTRPESISERLRSCLKSAPNWEPIDGCREKIDRFLLRVEGVKHRLKMPLIVAMLGGTGTGKSTLLNALVGEKVVREGKERPTTAEPILVCHDSIEPARWGIDLKGIVIEKRPLPALEQMVIIDCPDPDTTENEAARQTNLARLRAVLPLCDILLVTGTQQKYRSRKVLDELSAASPGARLVFVQTHADRDADIRADWSNLLEKDYEMKHIFRVDSVAALKAQQENKPVSQEFADLRQLLTRELNDDAAIRIRHANYFGLAQETVVDCRNCIFDAWTPVRILRERISEERRRFGERLAEQMRTELIKDRRLWESQLIGRVASQWGYSPFSMVLRVYQGLGSIISTAFLTRVRSMPQLAIWGTFESVRSIRNWSNRRKLKRGAAANTVSAWNEPRLRESALILGGFATDAKMVTKSCEPNFVIKESQQAGETFIADISRELELICHRLAAKNNRWYTRATYELFFSAMLVFVLVSPAKNFFYDRIVYNTPPYGIEFYVVSLFWLIAWGAVLLGFFTFSLRGGLDRQISDAAEKWNRLPALSLLFSSLEEESNQIMAFRDEIDSLYQRIERISQQADKLEKRLGRKKV